MSTLEGAAQEIGQGRWWLVRDQIISFLFVEIGGFSEKLSRLMVLLSN